MTGMKEKTAKHTVYLLIAAMIWGSAFVAQSAGNVMGPFTFNCLRNFLGFFVLIPFIRIFYRNFKFDRMTVLGGICCGICLFLASNTQQYAMQYTTPGKAGFITASYMLIVPIVGFFMGKGITRRIIFAVIAGAVGLYLLCIPAGEGFSGINLGDMLCAVCALLFTGHILCIDYFTPRGEGVKISCLQFLTAAVLTTVPMIFFEEPNIQGIQAGLVPLLYAGILSSGVGYSLQIVGQEGVNPAVAALILSLESCFAVLAGWIILGDAMNMRELLGCLIMFGAIVLTQLPGRKQTAQAKSI